MRQTLTYPVKIKHYNHIFKESVALYRNAVDFIIQVILAEWEFISELGNKKRQYNEVEKLFHQTSKNPRPEHGGFDTMFYKFPSYLRRAAVAEALGKVSSYKSNLKKWEDSPKESRGKEPSFPQAGYIYPTLYRGDMYQRVDDYTAQLKVFIRNTWDWITVTLCKLDADYIAKHCSHRKHCAPTLQKRGKEWYLDFPFEEKTQLHNTPVYEQTILAVDLGISQPCVISVMRSDGTILGRHFLRLKREQDSLNHCLNRIKKAQQHGNRKTPRLWAKAKGVNRDISVKTAQFIMKIAVLYNADTIVFEHLTLGGKKHGSKKQRLHLWRSRYVQKITTFKAHSLGMRISRINTWGTSRLAFDGSGRVERGTYFVDGVEKYNYSVCVFQTGKTYHCDLNATYNIGARYFIREILKSLSVTARFDVEAKVPPCTKRSTCTLSTLFHLNAVLAA